MLCPPNQNTKMPLLDDLIMPVFRRPDHHITQPIPVRVPCLVDRKSKPRVVLVASTCQPAWVEITPGLPKKASTAPSFACSSSNTCIPTSELIIAIIVRVAATAHVDPVLAPACGYRTPSPGSCSACSHSHSGTRRTRTPAPCPASPLHCIGAPITISSHPSPFRSPAVAAAVPSRSSPDSLYTTTPVRSTG